MNPSDPLTELDWNFDAVPDRELVACCYWEYARESAFIRSVRERCLDPKWRQMTNTRLRDHCGHDIERIQSIGHPSEVFLRGFFTWPDEGQPDFPPTEAGESRQPGGGFPGPWQALPTKEREERSHIGTDAGRIPLAPFERGFAMEAQDILDRVKRQRQQAEVERERVRRKHPRLGQDDLLRSGKLKFPEEIPSVYLEGGREVTLVGIHWGTFTNDQIVNHFRRWVKANRPRRLPAPSGRGHKPGDWRARLTRLAVMRLLSRFTALDLLDSRRNKLPAAWNTRQFKGLKWLDPTKWHDARREAGKIFRRLLPFVPTGETPRSWERGAPGKQRGSCRVAAKGHGV